MPSYLVTGASKGIGREFVRQIAARPNTTVFAVVRNPDDAAIKAVAASNKNVHIVKGDVTDPKSVLAAADEVSKLSGGKLDVLIHNSNATVPESGGWTPTQFPFDVAEMRRHFELPLSAGLWGAIWVTNAFLPLIEKGTEKKIIHLSTGLTDLELTRKTKTAYVLPYTVAKAAVNVEVAKYAVELAPKGIKVLALSPGYVNTYEGPEPMPAEMKGAVDYMSSQFAAVYGEAANGPIEVGPSVKAQLEVIDRLDAELSGHLVSHHGDGNWF